MGTYGARQPAYNYIYGNDLRAQIGLYWLELPFKGVSRSSLRIDRAAKLYQHGLALPASLHRRAEQGIRAIGNGRLHRTARDLGDEHARSQPPCGVDLHPFPFSFRLLRSGDRRMRRLPPPAVREERRSRSVHRDARRRCASRRAPVPRVLRRRSRSRRYACDDSHSLTTSLNSPSFM